MAPSEHDIEVATDALRTEATTWTAQSAHLTALAGSTGKLRFTGIEAGLFQIMLGPYTDVVNTVHDRCTEGSGEMTKIAATLHTVADVYDDEERRNVHALKNLY